MTTYIAGSYTYYFWRESATFLKAFISMAEFHDYSKVIEELTGKKHRSPRENKGNPLSEKVLGEYLCEECRKHRMRGKIPPEYVLEGASDVFPLKLYPALLVTDLIYVYNMVFTYKNRFLDIMVVHLIANEVLKVTILAIAKESIRSRKRSR